jgi:hypothetical protein
MKLAAIQAALEAKPLNQSALADAVNASYDGLRPYITELRRTKQIYIHGWGGVTCKHAIYGWGNKKDRKRPMPKTDIEKARRYKKRLLQEDPIRYYELELRRKKRRLKTPTKQQTWMVICA